MSLVQVLDPDMTGVDMYSKGDFHVSFTHFNSAEVPNEVLEWAVEMTDKSVGLLYAQSRGWDVMKKYHELAHVRCIYH
jgi:hypothetical protein